MLARLGFNPLEKLISFAKHHDPNIALGATKELCKYVYAQKKAIEVTATVDAALESSSLLSLVDEAKALFEAKLSERR